MMEEIIYCDCAIRIASEFVNGNNDFTLRFRYFNTVLFKLCIELSKWTMDNLKRLTFLNALWIGVSDEAFKFSNFIGVWPIIWLSRKQNPDPLQSIRGKLRKYCSIVNLITRLQYYEHGNYYIIDVNILRTKAFASNDKSVTCSLLPITKVYL